MAFESSQSATGRPLTDDERKVCNFIDVTLAASLEELAEADGDGNPMVRMARAPGHSDCSVNQESGTLEPGNTSSTASTSAPSWPGNTMQQAWRYGVLLRILGYISEAIRGDFVHSKRDIFYQDPLFFGSQGVVNRCIDIITSTVGVGRAALHVGAAAKGLIAGPFTIVLKDETELDVGTHAKGLLVPRSDDVKEVRLNDIRWILVVEKEAVFHRLATAKYHQKSTAGKGILITGKGYPDLCTRSFLRLLSMAGQPNSEPTSSTQSSMRPICMLVDGDPDGMGIMSTYKHGSIAHLHENANLSVGSIEWLGLRTSEMASEAGSLDDGSFIPLTLRDRRKAIAMLTRSPVFGDHGPEPKWRAELQRMLLMNYKAEIEALYERQGGVEAWLDCKLRGAD